MEIPKLPDEIKKKLAALARDRGMVETRMGDVLSTFFSTVGLDPVKFSVNLKTMEVEEIKPEPNTGA